MSAPRIWRRLLVLSLIASVLSACGNNPNNEPEIKELEASHSIADLQIDGAERVYRNVVAGKPRFFGKTPHPRITQAFVPSSSSSLEELWTSALDAAASDDWDLKDPSSGATTIWTGTKPGTSNRLTIHAPTSSPNKLVVSLNY